MAGRTNKFKRQDTGQEVWINLDGIDMIGKYNPDLKLKPKESFKNIAVVVLRSGAVIPLSFAPEKLVELMNAKI